MPLSARIKSRAVAFVVAYLLAWIAADAYLALKGVDWTLPAISLVVFGAALPLLGIALTRKAVPLPIPVKRPGLELSGLLAFLVVYAVGFLGWGMSATRAAVPAGSCSLRRHTSTAPIETPPCCRRKPISCNRFRCTGRTRPAPKT